MAYAISLPAPVVAVKVVMLVTGKVFVDVTVKVCVTAVKSVRPDSAMPKRALKPFAAHMVTPSTGAFGGAFTALLICSMDVVRSDPVSAQWTLHVLVALNMTFKSPPCSFEDGPP